MQCTLTDWGVNSICAGLCTRLVTSLRYLLLDLLHSVFNFFVVEGETIVHIAPHLLGQVDQLLLRVLFHRPFGFRIFLAILILLPGRD